MPDEQAPLPEQRRPDVENADPQQPDGTGQFSDVVLAESEQSDSPTIRAPSFRATGPTPEAPGGPAPTVRLSDPPRPPAGRPKAPMALLPGANVDDFEVVRLLGRGAFGHVYLARQISLDRLVALKVSANRGSEGRTMARLEHQHIVQVFSETVDRDFNQRLLCMQLVPGIGLDKLINVLHSTPEVTQAATPHWTGQQILAIIDSSAAMPTALDPSALHDREALARMDEVEATAWFGSRLAEALDFAHRHGVLHRDIKPANILVNPYGRPMLADFNISSQPPGSEGGGDEMFGGTFMYMSPEHLDAFNPKKEDTGPEDVTARSDIYSLALVLEQLLAGRMTFAPAKKKASIPETLREMSEERRLVRPPCASGPPGARMTLERTLGRCLAPNPDDRFASGAELAEQLEGCRQLRQARRNLPKLPASFDRILRRPFIWLVLLVMVPQVAGSIVNITYNATQIQLTEAQQDLFDKLVLGYNAVVYPIAVVLFVLAVRRAWKTWNALERGEHVADADVAAARRRALRLPRMIAFLVAFGWFPGGLLFPLLIHIYSPPPPLELSSAVPFAATLSQFPGQAAFSTVLNELLKHGLKPTSAVHFIASFCLSGLIALAYSLSGVESLVLRVIYPGLWQDARRYTEVARRELRHVPAQLGRIELFAGSIPLVACLLFLAGSPSDRPGFKFLVASLIVLGMVGFNLTSALTRNLSQVVVALTRTKD
jgi:serine/threonine protein kinase